MNLRLQHRLRPYVTHTHRISFIDPVRNRRRPMILVVPARIAHYTYKYLRIYTDAGASRSHLFLRICRSFSAASEAKQTYRRPVPPCLAEGWPKKDIDLRPRTLLEITGSPLKHYVVYEAIVAQEKVGRATDHVVSTIVS
jgi:hypothetical protein